MLKQNTNTLNVTPMPQKLEKGSKTKETEKTKYKQQKGAIKNSFEPKK